MVSQTVSIDDLKPAFFAQDSISVSPIDPSITVPPRMRRVWFFDLESLFLHVVTIIFLVIFACCYHYCLITVFAIPRLFFPLNFPLENWGEYCSDARINTVVIIVIRTYLCTVLLLS